MIISFIVIQLFALDLLITIPLLLVWSVLTIYYAIKNDIQWQEYIEKKKKKKPVKYVHYGDERIPIDEDLFNDD